MNLKNKTMSVQTIYTKGGWFTNPTFAVGLTAHAGGGQTSALQLANRYNTVSTVASGGDSVKMPVIVTEYTVVKVKNSSGTSLNLFPVKGGNLGAGVDTAVAVAGGASVEYVSTGNNNWQQV